MDIELLVGAQAFMDRAVQDCDRASRRVLVQAMTFEGDHAGHAMADAVLGSAAQDRRILVDHYTRMVISDQNVRLSRAGRGSGFASEVDATWRMFSALEDAGVGVRVTNPVGWRIWRYPARNHKKLIVADDVAYLGGINFSDHNFAWHDFMVRIEGPDAVDFLAADFAATYEGRPQADQITLNHLEISSLDGRNNRTGFRGVRDRIAAAKAEIVVISPYLSFPFTDWLAQASRRGVRIVLITPYANNKPLLRDALLGAATAGGFEVSLTAHMSHLKGMTIDGEALIVGSSNFDFVSLAAEEEFVAVITAPSVIAAFQADIIEPALRDALPDGFHRVSPMRATLSRLALGLAEPVAKLARTSYRGVTPWRQDRAV